MQSATFMPNPDADPLAEYIPDASDRFQTRYIQHVTDVFLKGRLSLSEVCHLLDDVGVSDIATRFRDAAQEPEKYRGFPKDPELLQ